MIQLFLLLLCIAYATGVLFAFSQIMFEDKELYLLCSYDELKQEILLDMLEAVMYNWFIVKSETIKAVFKSIFQLTKLNYKKLFKSYNCRVKLLKWLSDNHITGNPISNFLTFIVMKAYFEAKDELNIYETIITKHLIF